MWFDRRPRLDVRPPQASYPAWLRRVLYWYDRLTEWQRIQYAVAAILSGLSGRRR